MQLKRILLAGLCAGLALLTCAMLLYGVVFKDFMIQNLGSAKNIVKQPMDIPADAISNTAMGLLLSLILLHWSVTPDPKSAARKGLAAGALVAVFMDASFYGTTNAMDYAEMWVDMGIITFSCVIGALAAWYADWKWLGKGGARREQSAN